MTWLEAPAAVSTGAGEDATWWEPYIGTVLDSYSHARIRTSGDVWITRGDRDFTASLTGAECRRVAEMLLALADAVDADHEKAMKP
jgi:hypothetical protein